MQWRRRFRGCKAQFGAEEEALGREEEEASLDEARDFSKLSLR